jgi:hypothetical protein
MIQTNKGLQRIDSIFDSVNGCENLFALDEMETYAKIFKIHTFDNVETRKIVTADGFEFESALCQEYRVLKHNGFEEKTIDKSFTWKSVDKLKVGDLLVVKLRGHPKKEENPIPLLKIDNSSLKQPEYLTAEIARFFGILYGKTTYTEKGISIQVVKNQQQIIDFLDDVFDIRTVTQKDRIISIDSKHLVEWIHTNLSTTFREIPYIICCSPRKMVVEFINGYSDASYMSVPHPTFQQKIMQLSRSCGHKDFFVTNGFLQEHNGRSYFQGYFLDRITSIQASTCKTYHLEFGHTCNFLHGGNITRYQNNTEI